MAVKASIKPLFGQPKTLAAVQANIGIEFEYRDKLDRLIRAMQQDVVVTLRHAYENNAPEGLALDKSPAAILNEAMSKLSRRWLLQFNDIAPALAKYFAASAAQRTDVSLRSAMRRAGFTVDFKMSRAANDALQAVIAENVGLIKSIASENLTDVQGILMRSVARGRDIGGMVKELEERYDITRRRAALIARDQNNKATAIIQRVRQSELGITEAIWMHSSAGRHPRPSHVAMNGKRYLIAEGMYDENEGKKILPGELINCRCFCKAIIPGLHD